MEPGASDSALQDALRSLPSVDHLLKQPTVATLLDEVPRTELVSAIRAVLDEQREAIRRGQSPRTDLRLLALEIRQKLYQRALPSLRRVINATGIVLHTGLGRAPLAPEVVEAIADVAAGYSTLELDIETGRRGDRQAHVRTLLHELTGAEDGVVVNNNAAATYLALSTLAAHREVIVSRGQLVEIGGSYRMPDIMAAAGCKMVEVGTTNRTHLRDYERAISEQTSVLLRVHTSNYRIEGFVTSPTLEELVKLARQHGLLVVDDLGSGLLAKDFPWPGDLETAPPVPEAAEFGHRAERVAQAPQAEDHGVSDAEWRRARTPRHAHDHAPPLSQWDEPTVRESVAAGADLTLFSGDKLLGGPQAGLIVGRAELIARLRQNPLMRTFRPDKMTLAGIEATLRLYRDPVLVHQRVPVLRMLAAHPEMLKTRAQQLERELGHLLSDATVFAAPDQSYAGGGSLPTLPFPTWVVRVRHPQLDASAIADALRRRDVPVICRVQDDALAFDLRTVTDEQIDPIVSALADVSRELAQGK